MNNILGKLFSSNLRVKILKFFFLNPNKEFYQAEIAQKIRVKVTSLQYELKSLVKIGLLKARFTKVKTYYRLNPRFIYYKELRSIFLKHHRKIR